MSAAIYLPKEGSVAARMVDYLRHRPAGEWVITAALADACGVESSSVQACLAAALVHRVVTKQQLPGSRLVAWRATTAAEQVASPKPLDDEPDEEQDFAAAPPAPPAALGSIFNLAAAGVDMPPTSVRPVQPVRGGGGVTAGLAKCR